MDVKLDDSWQDFFDREITQGRFGSAEAVVAEGLRLIVEREERRHSLKTSLEDAIAQGCEVSDDELDAAIEARAAELKRMGYAD